MHINTALPLAHARLLRLASPACFYPLAGRLVPWFATAALLLTLVALAIGLWIAPTHGQLGDAYRVGFVHVPAAWMSLILYLVMAGYAALALALNAGLPAMMMTALAPTGTMFTFVALWTGSPWGAPTRGSSWVWDAPRTCERILFFLYVGFLALRSVIDDPQRADRACAVLVLIGVLNIPIIYFSVRWWSALHRGASASLSGSPTVASTVLAGMLVLALAFWMYAFAVVLARVRCLMIERDADSNWIAQEGGA